MNAPSPETCQSCQSGSRRSTGGPARRLHGGNGNGTSAGDGAGQADAHQRGPSRTRGGGRRGTAPLAACFPTPPAARPDKGNAHANQHNRPLPHQPGRWEWRGRPGRSQRSPGRGIGRAPRPVGPAWCTAARVRQRWVRLVAEGQYGQGGALHRTSTGRPGDGQDCGASRRGGEAWDAPFGSISQVPSEAGLKMPCSCLDAKLYRNRGMLRGGGGGRGAGGGGAGGHTTMRWLRCSLISPKRCHGERGPGALLP